MIPDFGFYNMDCMEGMKQFPDNYFDLAIVDPPYGDAGGGGGTASGRGSRSTHFTDGRRKKDKNYKNWRDMGKEIRKKIAAWDTAPKQDYFQELFRVSRNQIIWGGQLL